MATSTFLLSVADGTPRGSEISRAHCYATMGTGLLLMLPHKVACSIFIHPKLRYGPTLIMMVGSIFLLALKIWVTAAEHTLVCCTSTIMTAPLPTLRKVHIAILKTM